MEKDLLLIMVNHETAFKFKVNENDNNVQYSKTMEISAKMVIGRMREWELKSLLVHLKQSSYRKIALKTKWGHNVLLTFKAP